MRKKRKYPERKDHGLDEEIKADIRELIKQGTSCIYELAGKFHCATSQVAGIKAAMTRLGS